MRVSDGADVKETLTGDGHRGRAPVAVPFSFQVSELVVEICDFED